MILSPENPYVQGGFMLQLKPKAVFTPQGILFSVPRMIIRRRQWHPTPVFSPGKSHGQWSLAGLHGVSRVRHSWAAKPPPSIIVDPSLH